MDDNVLNTRSKCRWATVMLAIIALEILVLLCSGCHAPQPVVITQRDSTHTERITTYRDTTIVVPGDEAVLRVGSDVLDIKHLVDQLRGEVRTIRGANQASLVISASNDTLTVMALCDAIQLRLDSVIQENSTLRSTVRTQASFLSTQPERQAPMPSWAKGVALAAGSIGLVLLLIILLHAKTTL